MLSSTEQFLQKFQQGVQELRSLETKLLCPNEVLPPLYFSGSHDVLSLDNMPSKIKQAKQDVIFDEANTLQREEAKVRRDSVAATLPSGKCTPMNWQQKGRNYNSEMMNNPNKSGLECAKECACIHDDKNEHVYYHGMNDKRSNIEQTIFSLEHRYKMLRNSLRGDSMAENQMHEQTHNIGERLILETRLNWNSKKKLFVYFLFIFFICVCFLLLFFLLFFPFLKFCKRESVNFARHHHWHFWNGV